MLVGEEITAICLHALITATVMVFAQMASVLANQNSSEPIAVY
jgi:hypothetical protein